MSDRNKLDEYRTAKLLAAMRDREVKSSDAPCDECDDDPVTAAAGKDIVIHGLAAPYDTPTGDGREIRSNALYWNLDEEGIPIIWDRQDGDHTGMVVGRVDELRSDDTGVFVERARLFGSDDPEATAAVARVAELIRENAIGWSVGLSDVEALITYRESESISDGETTITRVRADDQKQVTVSARLRHIALVDTPAFAGARPVLGESPVTAAAGVLEAYRADWFVADLAAEVGPLTVSTDGRVFGAIAGTGCYRDGTGKTCKTYTADPDPEMRNFHTSSVQLDNGNAIRVGILTAAGLHADTRMSLEQQRHHRENSVTAWAVGRAFENKEGGLSFAGQVIPGVDPTIVQQAAACPVSIEKWNVSGMRGLTLVGAHSVITPAFPVL